MVGNQEEENSNVLDFEETELRLGLPGRKDDTNNANGKRGFIDEEEAMDLKLNLSSNINNIKNTQEFKNHSSLKTPAAKAQVVGWPPVRSFRKNILFASQKIGQESHDKIGNNGVLVKVSMDGAPYLRKVDLNMYKSYQELFDALAKMFNSFTIVQGMKDLMNERKLMDLVNSCDYVPTYEDKDGDWMLVGDVPWGMFVDSCKRLRIMKGTEAIGLAPKAMEKCKNQS